MAAPLAALAPVALNVASKVAGKVADALSSSTSGAKGLEEKLAALDPKARGKIEKTATDFEAVFLENMLGQIFASTGTEGPLGQNGTGGDAYKSMLVNEYARTITKSGGVGIANSVMAEMIRIQERAAGGGA